MQLEKIIKTLSTIASNQIPLHHTSIVSSYHRIQASSSYHIVTDYCSKTLQNYGLETKLYKYPLNDNQTYLDQAMPQSWDCSQATLTLLSPVQRRLADYNENKLSLIQRSGPTPAKGIKAEIVVVDDGTSVTDYDHIDVNDRFVLTRGDVYEVYRLAVKQFGALGIIYDGMTDIPNVRNLSELTDALEYKSFWWREGDEPGFGFVITPQTGEWLREQIKSGPDKSVIAHALVKSRFNSNGFIEVVDAHLKGQEDKEFIIIAHLCHPQWMTNDNASGVAALMETARILQTGIVNGLIAPPRYSIRFLLVPEFHGLYPMIESNRETVSNWFAGLNLDMVGLDQQKTRSSLNQYQLPYCQASIIDSLFEKTTDLVFRNSQSYGGAPTAGYRFQRVPFVGGSDHVILNHPTLNVPCLMINTWPDPYYHTSKDTIEKIDPYLLEKISLISASLGYFITSMDYNDGYWVGNEILFREKHHIRENLETTMSSLREKFEINGSNKDIAVAYQKVMKQFRFMTNRLHAYLEDLFQLISDPSFNLELENWYEEINEFENKTELKISAQITKYLNFDWMEVTDFQNFTDLESKAKQLFPIRRTKSFVLPDHYVSRLTNEDQTQWFKLLNHKDYKKQVIQPLAQYWIDGAHSILDIVDLIEIETNQRPLDYLMIYYQLMEKMNLIQIINSPESK